ncbi:ankyrin repeat domain-containing protein [Bordetella sp. 2513F-2]
MTYKIFSRRRSRAVCLALALGLGSAGASWGAAEARDWWVYVHNDQVDNVRELLARGADPNVRYGNGQPAIMRAVVEGAWEVFDLLAADPRTDVEARNPADETPLMYLAVAGQTDRARKLIARGAQVNRLGWTPLHYAASKGQVDTARLLLEHRAMPNAPSPKGTTPLMMAAYAGSRPMLELLLAAGADPLTQDVDGRDVVDWAEAGKHTRLAASLRDLIARAQAERQQQRTGTRAAPPQEAPAAPAAATPPAAAAPAATAAPEEPSGVKGLSGVRLQNYD